MAHVLIVEDSADTVEVLTKVIQLKFPDWTTDSAASVPEARRKLADPRQPYDFAILDFKLPDEHGEVKGDFSVCQQIRQQAPSTRVIHITAYADDPKITLHVRDVHLEDFDTGCSISKDKTDWMDQVVAKLHSFRIEAKFNALFEPLQASRHELREVPKGGSVTNRLLDLCADTRLHWKFLAPAVQQRIRSVLSVDDSEPDNVRVSLIGEVRSK